MARVNHRQLFDISSHPLHIHELAARPLRLCCAATNLAEMALIVFCPIDEAEIPPHTPIIGLPQVHENQEKCEENRRELRKLGSSLEYKRLGHRLD